MRRNRAVGPAARALHLRAALSNPLRHRRNTRARPCLTPARGNRSATEQPLSDRSPSERQPTGQSPSQQQPFSRGRHPLSPCDSAFSGRRKSHSPRDQGTSGKGVGGRRKNAALASRRSPPGAASSGALKNRHPKTPDKKPAAQGQARRVPLHLAGNTLGGELGKGQEGGNAPLRRPLSLQAG